MSWSINSNWLRASEQKGVRVIGLVTLELQKTTALYLTDYASLTGSGATIELTIDGTPYDVEEGVDWAAATSNEVTADNIGEAMVAAVLASGDGWIIRYLVEANATGVNLTFILGEASYASSAITFGLTFLGEPPGTLVDLDQGPTSITFCKSHEPFIGSGGTYPNLVQDIRGLEMSVDPLTREIGIGTPEIDFSDVGRSGGIRWLMNRFMLYGKAVDIRVGFEGLAESDFESWPRCYIQKVTPKPGAGITLFLGDGLYDLTEGTVQGEWVNRHPLEMVQLILDSNVLPDRYDANSLDPENTDNDPIGHWVVSRYNDEEFGCMNGINDPTQALEVLNSLLVMMNGTLCMDQDGVWGFTLLDENAAAVRSFENSPDLALSSYPCKVTAYSDAFENITNSATINFAQSRAESAAVATYHELDMQSIRESLRVVETNLDLEWCNGVALVYGAYIYPGDGTNDNRLYSRASGFSEEYVIQYAPRQGFCGTRQAYDSTVSSFSPYLNSQLAASTRIAFHRVEGNAYATTSTFDFTRDPEILAFDLCDHFGQSGHEPAGWGPDQRLDSVIQDRSTPFVSYADSGIVGGVMPTTQSETLSNTWTDARFVIAATYSDYDFNQGRAGLGTTDAAARDGNPTPGEDRSFKVVDITIPVDIAKRWIRRARFGMPKMTIEVGANHYDLALSDFVQLTDDVYLGFRQSDLANGGSATFEITRKRCRLFEADPCMEFEISFLRSTLTPPSEIVPVYDPTVTVGTATFPDFIVDNDSNMVVTDQDFDGVYESYTLKA